MEQNQFAECDRSIGRAFEEVSALGIDGHGHLAKQFRVAGIAIWRAQVKAYFRQQDAARASAQFALSVLDRLLANETAAPAATRGMPYLIEFATKITLRCNQHQLETSALAGSNNAVAEKPDIPLKLRSSRARRQTATIRSPWDLDGALTIAHSDAIMSLKERPVHARAGTWQVRSPTQMLRSDTKSRGMSKARTLPIICFAGICSTHRSKHPASMRVVCSMISD